MRWKHYINQLISAEISVFSRYYDHLIQWHQLAHDPGDLFEGIECSKKTQLGQDGPFPNLNKEEKQRTLVFLNGVLNHHLDIQTLLSGIRNKLSRTTRLGVVLYNPYFRGLYWLANRLGLRKGDIPITFITHTDLGNIVKLAGYEVVRIRPVAYVPFRWFGIGTLINRVFPAIPFLRWFSYAAVVVFRPIIPEKKKPSLTVVIPACNEKGNIENALKRMPDMGTVDLEIIFVEGHSTDQTWEEIQRVMAKYRFQFAIKAFLQTGKGKNDAVRLGFSHASKELLTILDADLTMPPELLEQFYQAYCQGIADFINGSRLVYSMEGGAMQFLNRLGNIFFAKSLSFVLDTRLGDSLCGTKLMTRHDYQRFVAWRRDFGDFDPFGDYELLFPASILSLGIIDVPIHYRSRTYGQTSISRFSHGLMLLRMTLTGFFRIKLGNIPPRHLKIVDS